MKISATSFALRILDAAKELIKSLSHLRLTVTEDIRYSIDNFVEKLTYDRAEHRSRSFRQAQIFYVERARFSQEPRHFKIFRDL